MALAHNSVADVLRQRREPTRWSKYATKGSSSLDSSNAATSNNTGAMAAVWTRTDKGGAMAAAVDREVDEDAIEAMLTERSSAKSVKNYKLADKIAAKLQLQA